MNHEWLGKIPFCRVVDSNRETICSNRKQLCRSVAWTRISAYGMIFLFAKQRLKPVQIVGQSPLYSFRSMIELLCKFVSLQAYEPRKLLLIYIYEFKINSCGAAAVKTFKCITVKLWKREKVNSKNLSPGPQL